jgi:hypothetical protein
MPGVQWKSPKPIPHGDFICIVVEGVLKNKYVYDASSLPYRYGGDACYWWYDDKSRSLGKYCRLKNLHIDSSSTDASPFDEQHLENQYRFAYRGRGAILYLFFNEQAAFKGKGYSGDYYFKGSLTVTLEPLSEEAILSAKEGKIALHGLEISPEERQAIKHQKQNEAALARLLGEYEEQPLLSDAKYLDDYARRNQADLLASAEEILADHREFQGNHELVTILKNDHPEIYERRLWQLRVLQRALQADVAEPDIPPKSTAEERQQKFRAFRERAVEKERVHIEDDQAKVMVAFEAVERILDARELKIAEINDRDDLSPEAKDERIRGIRAMTEHQLEKLLGGSNHGTSIPQPDDAGEPPIVLGQ